MPLPASVVVGGIGAALVCIAAFATLGVVYSYSATALERAGLDQARLMVATPAEKVRGLLEPTIALNRAIQYTVRDPVSPFKLQADMSADDWRAQWRRVQLFASVAGSFDFQSVNAQLVDSGFTKVQRIHPNVWAHTTLDARNRDSDGGVSVLTDEQYREDSFTSILPLRTNGQNPKFDSVQAAPYLNGNSSFGGMKWFGPFYTVVPVIMSLSMTAALHNASGAFLGISVINVKIDQINDILRGVERTENSHVFVFDQNEYIVATSHPNSMFDTSVVDPASPKPRNCFRTSFQSATLNTTTQSCRKALSAFDYAPLQSLASSTDCNVLTTSTSATNTVDADSQHYFVSGRRVQLSVTDGATFNVVVFIPEDDIFEHAVTGRNAAIGISVAIVIVALIVTALASIMFTRPLDDLGKRMEATALLQEDMTEPTPSCVKEIAMMQAAYVAMKNELVRLKPFLPQALMRREGDVREENLLSGRQSGGPSVSVSEESLSKSFHLSVAPPGFEDVTQFTVGPAQLREETNTITPRDCVVVMISISYGIELDEVGSIPVLDNVFRTIVSAADVTRGVIENITPYQIMVTFGVRSTLSDPAGEALAMSLRIARATRRSTTFSATMLIDSCSVFVGCCGTERFRQNVVFSEDIEALRALAVSSHMLHRHPVVATSRITPSFGKRAVMLPLDWIGLHSGEKLALHAVTQRTKSLGMEEEAVAARELRAAFAKIANGELDEAVEILGEAEVVIGKHVERMPQDGSVTRMSAHALVSLKRLVEYCRQRGLTGRLYVSWGCKLHTSCPFVPISKCAEERQPRAQKQLQTLGNLNAIPIAGAFEDDGSATDGAGAVSLFPMAFTEQASMDDESLPQTRKNVRAWQLSALPIGTGSFGKVYRGLNSNGSLAAVKVLPLHSRVSSIDALQKELAITAQQRHENLVGYVDAEIEAEELLIVTELMAGGSLEGLLRDFGALPARMVRRFTLSVLRGLAHLHRAGIVHCDVKPQNVLLGVDGTCKLADFGSALHPRQTSGLLSASGEEADSPLAIGTPVYMAPEVARGEEPTAASDVWSLGVMVHELLTESLPFNAAQTAVLRTGSSNVVRMVGRLRDDAQDSESVEAAPRPKLHTTADDEMINGFLAACLVVDPAKRLSVDALMLKEFLL